MDADLHAFFQRSVETMPSEWTMEQTASELAQYAVEAIADLPELDYRAGVESQKEFDSAVEGAYTFYKGEALTFLDIMTKRTTP